MKSVKKMVGIDCHVSFFPQLLWSRAFPSLICNRIFRAVSRKLTLSSNVVDRSLFFHS